MISFEIYKLKSVILFVWVQKFDIKIEIKSLN